MIVWLNFQNFQNRWRIKTVGADSFAKAQEKLCDEMPVHKTPVAFVFPYVEEDTE